MAEPSGWQIEQAMASLHSVRQDASLQEDDQALLAAIEAGEENVYELLRRVIRAAIEADALADACDVRIADIQDRKKRFKARNEALRRTAFVVLDALGETKLKDAEFTASIGKPRDSLLITNEAEIPEEYWKTTKSLDKAKLAEDVKNGVVITGAMLANGIPTFTLRTK